MKTRNRHSERGTTLILIMTLLAILSILVFSNGRVISQLRKGLKQIETQHERQFQAPPK
jgi:Tfp pilus assembly protein PilX